MQLNKGQEAASQAVFQFLIGDDKEFCLSGPAGVGKTFMLKHIMDNIMKEYEDACTLLNIDQKIQSIELTATTNKAADVLGVSTGHPTQTIHSFMNLKVFDDYTTGRSKLKKTPNWDVHSGKLIFIDEASMIDSDLHKVILEGTDNTCKIVYVGDHCQMAPVFEEISPIYRNPKHFVQLTEPVRNAEQPALMNLCNQLRETVETGVFKPIQPIPGVIDYIGDDELRNILKTQFTHNEHDGRILCYTNKRVHQFNDYIRNMRGDPDHFVPGEIVVNNSALEMGKTVLKVEQEFKIVRCSPEQTTQVDGTDFKFFDVTLQYLSGKGTISVPVPADKDHFTDLLNYFKRNKTWRPYYDLKNNYADLRQKDASTVYKAQGSTYEFAVMDIGDIGTCRKADQAARMLYVGASRPRQRLYLYGSLPDKYQGN